MKSWIRRRPIVAYVVIMYAVAWLLNVPALLGKVGLGIIPVDVPYEPGALAGSVLGLAGVAFLVTGLKDGRPGVRELLRRFYHFRVGPRWYVLALFLPSALMLPLAVATRGTAALNPWTSHLGQFFSVYVVNVIIGALLISLCEEAGWTAFVTARLQQRWGALRTCLAVGPLQGAFHFPLLFMAGTVAVGGGRLHWEDAPLILFFLLVGISIPSRIIYTWFWNSTGGSLPVVALTHQAFDQLASAAFVAIFLIGVDITWEEALPAIAAIAIVVLTRGRLGYRTAQPTQIFQPVMAAAGAQS